MAPLDGTVGFVGVSGELFCEHALTLRRRARLRHLVMMGYCNDYQQYFPTIQASAEGGYGTVPPMAVAEVGAGERMMDRRDRALPAEGKAARMEVEENDLSRSERRQ